MRVEGGEKGRRWIVRGKEEVDSEGGREREEVDSEGKGEGEDE